MAYSGGVVGVGIPYKLSFVWLHNLIVQKNSICKKIRSLNLEDFIKKRSCECSVQLLVYDGF